MKKLESALKKLNSAKLDASKKGPKALIAGLAYSGADEDDDYDYELAVVMEIGYEAASALREAAEVLRDSGGKFGMSEIAIDIPKCMKVFGYNPNVEILLPDDGVEWDYFPKGLDERLYGSFRPVDDAGTIAEIRKRARKPEKGYQLILTNDGKIGVRMNDHDVSFIMKESAGELCKAVYRYQSGNPGYGVKDLEKPAKAPVKKPKA